MPCPTLLLISIIILLQGRRPLRFWQTLITMILVRPQDGTIGNSTVLIEGIHMEYVPVTKNGTFRSP